METLDDITYAAIVFLILVKSAGYFCLLGIGLGFGLSSWLLCRLYRRISNKVLPDAKKEKTDSNSLPAIEEPSNAAEPSHQTANTASYDASLKARRRKHLRRQVQ